MQNLGRWVCSSVLGEVEGNQLYFQQQSAYLRRMSHHFHEILMHEYSPWESWGFCEVHKKLLERQ